MLQSLKNLATRPLPLNRDQRKLISGVFVALATFAATQGVGALGTDPARPGAAIALFVIAACLTVQGVLALREPKDECRCERGDD